MLRSSNVESIFDTLNAEIPTPAGTSNSLHTIDFANGNGLKEDNSKDDITNSDNTCGNVKRNASTCDVLHNFDQQQLVALTSNGSPSPSCIQLAKGTLEIYEPTILNMHNHIKEFISKQNKVKFDLSTEKFKYDNDEMDKLNDMVKHIKIYREKLIKIKKQMQAIYQRTKNLKKRAENIQLCKRKQLQRQLDKQQQEEDLIGK